MTNGERVALRIELDPAADPIRGLLAATTGEVHEFVGWLGLASAIERLLPRADRAKPLRDEHPM